MGITTQHYIPQVNVLLEAVEGAGNISLAEGPALDSQGTLRFLDLGLLWPGER